MGVARFNLETSRDLVESAAYCRVPRICEDLEGIERGGKYNHSVAARDEKREEGKFDRGVLWAGEEGCKGMRLLLQG